MKFRFVDEALIEGKLLSSENPGLLGSDQLEDDGNIDKLFGSEEALLEYDIKKKKG